MELVNHPQEALELVGDEKKDYLYAVVDKANKKKEATSGKYNGNAFLFGCLCFSFSFLLIQAFGNIDQKIFALS